MAVVSEQEGNNFTQRLDVLRIVTTLLSHIFEDKSKHIPFCEGLLSLPKDSISFPEHFKYPPNILYLSLERQGCAHMGQKCQISS